LLSFDYLHRQRKSKDKVILHENEKVSVIKYSGRMGMERGTEKYKRYII